MRIFVSFPMIMKAQFGSFVEFDQNTVLGEIKRRVFAAFERTWPGVALEWRGREMHLYVAIDRDPWKRPDFEITTIQMLHVQIARGRDFVIEFGERENNGPPTN